MDREDGYPGLAKAYGLKLKNIPQQLDLGLMYKALAGKKIDIGNATSTDSLIPRACCISVEAMLYRAFNHMASQTSPRKLHRWAQFHRLPLLSLSLGKI